MGIYTYFTTDLRTGQKVAELPLRSVTFSHELNEPGSLSGVVDLFADGARPDDMWMATLPARTAIYADLDGELVWGGIIWRRRKGQDGTLSVDASGFLSYYSQLCIADDLSYTAVDQFTIAEGIVNAAQARFGADIGISVPTGTSGIVRTQAYKGDDRQQVLEALQGLGQLLDGFEIAVGVGYDDRGYPDKRLLMGHPGLGRTKESTDLVLMYPGQISSYDWPEEGDRIANVAHVRGDPDPSDTTSTTQVVTEVNFAPVTEGYPRLEKVYSAPVLRSTDTLTSYAQSMLAAYSSGAVSLPTFELGLGVEDPPLASYGAGDHFRLIITDPEWFPAGDGGEPGYDGAMRIVSRSVTVDDDGGGHTVSLTVAPVEYGAVSHSVTPPSPAAGATVAAAAIGPAFAAGTAVLTHA